MVFSYGSSLLSIFVPLILFILFQYTDSGANNLHLYDTSNMRDIMTRDVYFEILEPSELKYTYRARPAKNFGGSFNETFYQRKALLVPVQPIYSCGYPINADDLKGNIALVERGECSFLSKTIRAQEAGAVAVIIADNTPVNDDLYIEMIDDSTDRSPEIPAAFLLGANGYMIRRKLEELRMDFAVVNIPLNLTFVSFHEMKQPPWLMW